MADYIRMFEDLYKSNPKLGNMMLGAYGRGGLTGLLGQYNMGTGSKWQPKPKPAQAQAPVEQPAPMPVMPTYNPQVYQAPQFMQGSMSNMASFLGANPYRYTQQPFVNPAEMYRTYNIGAPQYQTPMGNQGYAPREPIYRGLQTKPMMGS